MYLAKSPYPSLVRRDIIVAEHFDTEGHQGIAIILVMSEQLDGRLGQDVDKLPRFCLISEEVLVRIEGALAGIGWTSPLGMLVEVTIVLTNPAEHPHHCTEQSEVKTTMLSHKSPVERGKFSNREEKCFEVSNRSRHISTTCHTLPVIVEVLFNPSGALLQAQHTLRQTKLLRRCGAKGLESCL